MPARSIYSDYYESGTAVRKKEYKEIYPKTARKKASKTSSNIAPKPKNNVFIFLSIVLVFSMFMFLTYRFNIINEKNLESQSLKTDLKKIESILATSQIDVEQSTDLNKIEAYAKQQLGMQKPDKNQTIYVDTSKTSKTVEIQNDNSGIEKIIDSVKKIVNNIF
ncbi:MAG: hypothetical protein RSB67_02025 [Clostridia bacterium]